MAEYQGDYELTVQFIGQPVKVNGKWIRSKTEGKWMATKALKRIYDPSGTSDIQADFPTEQAGWDWVRGI